MLCFFCCYINVICFTADISKRNKRKWSALSLAARAGHLTTLKLLLDEEVNRACRAQFPDWPVTTTIRDMGSNAAADEPTTTAASMFSVLTSEQTKFVEDAKKAIVNQTDGNGCTPLITAAGQYHREIVTYLLQEGSISFRGDIHHHLPCTFLIIFVTALHLRILFPPPGAGLSLVSF